jgi:5'-methylthioadenosine phosphorylase
MGGQADVGVFGGSGLYRFLRDVTEVRVDTPWGPTSAPVTIGDLGDRKVAFLPRHGREHTLPPHRVPYRANVWAMRELGVGALLAPFAAGSLQRDIEPGEVVVCDQLVDRTWGRPDTFYDTFEDGPAHVSLADPYDDGLRDVLVDTARQLGLSTHERGTVVVIQGPRFSTRAESRWYREMGWHVINMTQYPEAALAREAGLPFCGMALVTDHDAGVDGIAPVTQEAVFAVFERNVERVRALLAAAIPRLPLRAPAPSATVPAVPAP